MVINAQLLTLDLPSSKKVYIVQLGLHQPELGFSCLEGKMGKYSLSSKVVYLIWPFFMVLKAAVYNPLKSSRGKITRLNETTEAYFVALLVNAMLGSC